MFARVYQGVWLQAEGGKARTHGAADEKPGTLVQSGLGDVVLGRLSDGDLLSNIMNDRRIRHFGSI